MKTKYVIVWNKLTEKEQQSETFDDLRLCLVKVRELIEADKSMFGICVRIVKANP